MFTKWCKQCGHVKFKGTMTNWPVKHTQKSTRHTEQQYVTDIQNNLHSRQFYVKRLADKFWQFNIALHGCFLYMIDP